MLIPTPRGAQIPLVQVADVVITKGPPMITDEAGSLAGLVSVAVSGRDLRGYVEEAQRAVREHVQLPAGYTLQWAGQYEHLQRANRAIEAGRAGHAGSDPVAALSQFPFNGEITDRVAVGALCCRRGNLVSRYLLGYNLSVAVWVGIIALAGVAAETGVVMVVYLDEAYDRWQREGRMVDSQDLREAILEGAVQRVRPKMMTVAAIIGGLLPIMWTTGTGADVMKRIAAPMVGGMVSSTILTLLVIPAIYGIWRWRQLKRYQRAEMGVLRGL